MLLKLNFTIETKHTSSRKEVAAAAPGAAVRARAGAAGRVAASRVAAAGARVRAVSAAHAAASFARVEQQAESTDFFISGQSIF